MKTVSWENCFPTFRSLDGGKLINVWKMVSIGWKQHVYIGGKQLSISSKKEITSLNYQISRKLTVLLENYFFSTRQTHPLRTIDYRSVYRSIFYRDSHRVYNKLPIRRRWRDKIFSILGESRHSFCNNYVSHPSCCLTSNGWPEDGR